MKNSIIINKYPPENDQQCNSCLSRSWEEQNKNVRYFDILINHTGFILCEDCAARLRNLIDNALECK